MKTLNIRDALTLYDLIGYAIPEKVEKDSQVLDFVGTIIEKIKNSDTPERFGEALVLMSGKPSDELSELDGREVLKLFTDGIINNNILQLALFCKSLNL